MDYLKHALMAVLLAAFMSSAPAAEARQPEPVGTVIVTGFAPDALIAIDGNVVGTGTFQGPLAPGSHRIQVYRPGGPAYEFQVNVVAGEVHRIPEAAPAPAPAAPPPEPATPKPAPRRDRDGPYVLAQVGFMAPTTKPDGFSYPLVTDEETGQLRERAAPLGFVVGATGGYRITRGIGLGGFLLYGRAASEGTVRQTLSLSDGSQIARQGAANFTVRSLHIGPHARFMAGGDRARFLSGFAFGAQHIWLEQSQVNLAEQNGVIVEQGETTRQESGWGQFVAFDLGAEFGLGDALLLGVALDFVIASTQNVSSDPFGGTALGYVGMSARLGWHDWMRP